MEEVKIYNYSWHLAHQYELLKLPNTQWYWNVNNVRPNWVKHIRPDTPTNLNYVPYYEPGKYDFALLHLDQATICRDSKLSRGKNVLSGDINEVVQDIPKVVINHGTPYWPEIEDVETGRYSMEWLKLKCREFVGDNVMVVNSNEARNMWGMGRTIIHGLDSNEWWDLPKEMRVITTMSPAGWNAYYGRLLFDETQSYLHDYRIKIIHVGSDFLSNDFDDYRNFIGRALIYFNPTKESPMPRARTEAMLSGACIVSAPGQDIENYLNCNLRKVWLALGEQDFTKAIDTILREGKDNINGIIAPENPKGCAMIIKWLYENYDVTCQIGQNGKAFAQKVFSMERFQNEWAKLIKEVCGKDILCN